MTRVHAKDREKPGLPTLSQGAHKNSQKHSNLGRRVDRVGCTGFSPRTLIRPATSWPNSNLREHA
jgi:hypothetical protein